MLSRDTILLFHIFFVGPLLAYVGYKGKDTNQSLFDLLLIIGVVVSLYHAYTLYKWKKITG